MPYNIINKYNSNSCIYFLQSWLYLTHIIRNSKNERVPDFPQIPVCKHKKIIFRTYNYFRIKTRPSYYPRGPIMVKENSSKNVDETRVVKAWDTRTRPFASPFWKLFTFIVGGQYLLPRGNSFIQPKK